MKTKALPRYKRQHSAWQQGRLQHITVTMVDFVFCGLMKKISVFNFMTPAVLISLMIRAGTSEVQARVDGA